MESKDFEMLLQGFGFRLKSNSNSDKSEHFLLALQNKNNRLI
jgi:hypothetical protein